MNYGFDEWRRNRLLDNGNLAIPVPYMSSGSTGNFGVNRDTPERIKTIEFGDKNAIMDELENARKLYQDYLYEVDCTVTSDGSVWITHGGAGTVYTEGIETEHGVSLKGSYSYHNHPKIKTNYSVSGEDIGTFLHFQNQYMEASDHQYRYWIERTEATKNASYYEAFRAFRNKEDEINYANRNDLSYNPDVSTFNTVAEHLSSEYGFIYRRQKHG